jgi:hypothetical protein
MVRPRVLGIKTMLNIIQQLCWYLFQWHGFKGGLRCGLMGRHLLPTRLRVLSDAQEFTWTEISAIHQPSPHLLTSDDLHMQMPKKNSAQSIFKSYPNQNRNCKKKKRSKRPHFPPVFFFFAAPLKPRSHTSPRGGRWHDPTGPSGWTTWGSSA